MSDLQIESHKRKLSDETPTVEKRTKHTPDVRPGLDRLPEEVLLVVLDVLLACLVRCRALNSVLEHIKAFHSLCLTNRRFNRLATPYLCTFISNRNRRRVPQALDAMILDPKKAEGIKYVSWALDVKRSSQAMCRRSPRAESIYLQKLGRLGIPELAGELRQCFHGNAPEYYLATALVLAPNLEYLETADVNYEQDTVEGAVWRPTWLELLALKALSSPPGLSHHFQSLQHLSLNMGELNFEQIRPLLRLPALRTLHLIGGWNDHEISAHAWDTEVGQRRSTVETLIFESCVVTSEIIVQVLNAIRNLRTLRLESSCWYLQRGDGSEEVSLLQSRLILCKAIAEHKESLERLYMAQASLDNWMEIETESSDAIGQAFVECLRGMHKLRYLDTGLESVYAYSAILPDTVLSSLEHLILEDSPEKSAKVSIERTLTDLSANCKTRLPALRDVVVWLTHWLPDLDLSGCKAAFESQGVDIAVMSYNTDQREWQLHTSNVEENSALGVGSWGCRLKNVVDDPVRTDYRVPITFHGPCGMYHDPSGRSIIDHSGRR